MDMMEIRRRILQAMASGTQNLVLLRTLTFENTNARQTFTPDANWADYDFLLIVPDLTIVAQAEQTSGNWLWFQITGDRGTANNYEGTSSLGVRNISNCILLSKGYYSDRFYWRWIFLAGRGGNLQLKAVQDIDSETFADLTYTYGGYQQGTNGLLNGVVRIYGGKLPTN